MDTRRESQLHRLIGGELCLDFANTLNGHDRLTHHEYLHDYRDLVLWGRHAGILQAQEARVLLGQAQADPAQAQIVFRQGLELREALFRTFRALAGGRSVYAGDLEGLNTAWHESQAHARLVRVKGGFRQVWDDEPCLERISRAVLASAIRLLTSPQLAHIRSCAGRECDWLFADGSRNHLRRWCSMDECGNRAKMQRRQRKLKLSTNGG